MNKVFVVLTLSIFGACSPAAETDWPRITAQAKPWTRWWWPGSDVDSVGLAWNLREMARAGIGGVEITPIYGVRGREEHYIDYLSPRWMRMFGFTMSEAARLGMGVDMNMGTGWPFGGPEVTGENAATRAIFRRREPSNGGMHDTIELTVGKTGQRVKRAAPGGEGLVLDHFNAEAVRHYLDKFDKAFRGSDTPFPRAFFNDSYEVYDATWTPALLDEFERRRGYKLQDHFAELISDGAGETTEAAKRVIYDYRETMDELLLENFTEQWTRWAHERGVTTRNQAHGSPANLLDIYAAVDVPECESFGVSDFRIPGLRRDPDAMRKENDGDPATLKWASSAAHVTGKPYTSAETFTWLTEHFRTSLSQCKPEIDQMFTAGVNRVYFHGSTYSPPDAPWPGWKFYASIDMSPTNTIWRDAPAFFRYIARVQSFLQLGEPDNDFLLYLPMAEMRMEERGGYFKTYSIHGMRDRMPEFYRTVENITTAGYDVDYISDRLLRGVSVTADGALKTQGGVLYKALVLPAVKFMPPETGRLIEELTRQGAKVVTATGTGNHHARIPAACGATPEAFVAECGGRLIRRRNDTGHHYFMTMLADRTVDGWVALGVDAASVMLFDPMTGQRGRAAVRQRDGRTEVYLQLRPGESLILRSFTHINIEAPDWNYLSPEGTVTTLDSKWTLSFVESQPAIEGEFELTGPVSWTTLDHPAAKTNMGTALYTTHFDFHKSSGSEYRLNLGDVRESARVRVNGRDAGTVFAVPFTVEIGHLLDDGPNTIEVEVTNLPANRIADYDRRGVEWRIFHEINFVNVAYTDERYDKWLPLPSGLPGPVTIHEMQALKPVKF